MIDAGHRGTSSSMASPRSDNLADRDAALKVTRVQ